MKQNHKLATNSKSDILQYAMESSFNIKLTFLQNLWSEKCSDVDAEYIIFTAADCGNAILTPLAGASK